MAVRPQFTGYIEAETQRAFFFQDHYWHEPEWMPKSQVNALRDPDSFEVTLVASVWIAGQKDIKEGEERLPQEEPDGQGN